MSLYQDAYRQCHQPPAARVTVQATPTGSNPPPCSHSLLTLTSSVMTDQKLCAFQVYIVPWMNIISLEKFSCQDE
ncbi:hypothetical protein E2I00_017600 [Balaenoptera physalus]|uniref:Uncharacterized protein n=1 Tax=Balaenoptera physalus TaxID=9770 RepID=A0A6A1PZU7_BALPH|nr:hypothetical protein E2I00_017600 [Balaenoptera physalus]